MAEFAEAVLPILALAAVAGASDVLGGWLALRREHFDDPRYIIAFSSGIVVAAVFFELLPEAVAGVAEESLQGQMLLVAAGFFSFYVVEKGLMLHACGEPECTTHAYSPTMVAGMAADNVVDGVGIAAGYLLDPAVGIIVTLVVVAHEIPQGITSAELLKHASWKRRNILIVLFIAGSAYVVGASLASVISPEFYQGALAFVTGTFIYIGAADLMGEAHRRFNALVMVSVMAGAALMLALTSVEGLIG
ncbi:MAG TPA: ZIP family metal transporter [Candidatus Thermoplasmatota archaeon]